MKKFVLILIVVLAAAGAALPWVNGKIMETQVQTALEQINQAYDKAGTGIRFELTAYDRGYGKTRAEWKLNLGLYGTPYGISEIIFTEQAVHGWTDITSETGLEKNPWYADWVAGPLKGQNPLKIRTQYKLFSPITSWVTLDPFVVEPQNGKPTQIGALALETRMAQDFKNVAVKGTWDGLTEEGDNRLGPVSFDSAQERVTDLVWQGKIAILVKTLAIHDDQTDLSVTDLSLTSDVTADKDAKWLDTATAMKAKDIRVNDQALSDWALGVNLKHLDISAFEDLYTVYAKLMGQVLKQTQEPGLSQEESTQRFQQIMLQHQTALIAGAEKLMKQGFAFEIPELDITLPQGQIKGRLSLGLLKDMTLAGFIPVAAQPAAALDIFALDTDISLPRAFEAMIPNLTLPLFPGMETGFFVLDGERLSLKAQTRDKALYLNGHLVDLEM